ncbi:MAG: EAL domain-containing protein [Pseudomonadota bacterium]
MLIGEIVQRQSMAADGAWFARFNASRFRTAFQTIFEMDERSAPKPYAAEALCRITRGQTPVSITAFLHGMRSTRVLLADCNAMALHVRNYASLQDRPENLFLNADPRSAHKLSQVHHALAQFAAYVEDMEIPTSNVIIELTEEHALSEDALSFTAMALRKFGFGIAIDDFGARASNLVRLVALRPDYLKFDRLWLSRLLEQRESRALLASKVERLKGLGVKLVAEGLETPEQIHLTREVGIDLFQGYALQRPEPSQLYVPCRDIHRVGAAHPEVQTASMNTG